jgi:hypothetical protein
LRDRLAEVAAMVGAPSIPQMGHGLVERTRWFEFGVGRNQPAKGRLVGKAFAITAMQPLPIVAQGHAGIFVIRLGIGKCLPATLRHLPASTAGLGRVHHGFELAQRAIERDRGLIESLAPFMVITALGWMKQRAAIIVQHR